MLEVEINAGGLDIRMTKQRLNGEKIGAAF